MLVKAAKSKQEWLEACQAAYDLLRADRQDSALLFTTDPYSCAFVEEQVGKACHILREALGDQLDKHPSKVELQRWRALPNSPHAKAWGE